MKSKKFVFSILFLLVILLPFDCFCLTKDYQSIISDITNTKLEDGKINFYFFRGEGCPHCKKEEEWLKKIKKEYKDDINFYDYEVWYNKDNSKMLKEVSDKFDMNIKGVPFTVIGNDYFSGFSDTIKTQMENSIKKYLKKGNSKKISIPILGKVDVKNSSIGLIGIILGFVDGFNPCAMWILLFLINMFIGMKDKKKAWILGSSFLLVSALVYFLSMLGINFVIGITAINYLKIALAIFILVMGILSLRKYLTMRKEEDGCSVVDDKKRKKMIVKIKKIMNSRGFIFSLFGIITLAVSVNLIELACSLGFPVIYTEILNINNVSGFSKIIYLLIYILFYMLDDLFVFTISMITLEATGITNKYNKLSTLISSIIMIIMGILLLIKPEWLMLNF